MAEVHGGGAGSTVEKQARAAGTMADTMLRTTHEVGTAPPRCLLARCAQVFQLALHGVRGVDAVGAHIHAHHQTCHGSAQCRSQAVRTDPGTT